MQNRPILILNTNAPQEKTHGDGASAELATSGGSCLVLAPPVLFLSAEPSEDRWLEVSGDHAKKTDCFSPTGLLGSIIRGARTSHETISFLFGNVKPTASLSGMPTRQKNIYKDAQLFEDGAVCGLSRRWATGPGWSNWPMLSARKERLRT